MLPTSHSILLAAISNLLVMWPKKLSMKNEKNIML